MNGISYTVGYSLGDCFRPPSLKKGEDSLYNGNGQQDQYQPADQGYVFLADSFVHDQTDKLWDDQIHTVYYKD